jgi:hypothetical protein
MLCAVLAVLDRAATIVKRQRSEFDALVPAACAYFNPFDLQFQFLTESLLLCTVFHLFVADHAAGQR